jgi:hypothetical protein
MLWKDSSTIWETLASMKEAFPVQIANFAVSNNYNLQDCITIQWWVLHVLRVHL